MQVAATSFVMALFMLELNMHGSVHEWPLQIATFWHHFPMNVPFNAFAMEQCIEDMLIHLSLWMTKYELEQGITMNLC